MTNLYGLILSGGKSSRLGFPKYKIEKDGIPLYQWWAKTLNAVCEKTYISCQISQQTEIDYPFLILDESNNAGPLEGIYKAFQLNNNVNWLVAACDLVYVELNHVLELVVLDNEGNERLTGGQIPIDAICFQNPETGEPFPLLTIYNSQIESALNQEYHSELKSAKRLLIHSNTRKIIPSNASILKGINSPDDLDTWKKSLK